MNTSTTPSSVALGLPPMTRWGLAQLLLSKPLAIMLVLMVIEAALSAGTTWLVIETGRDVANDQFVLWDLFWILIVQSASYVVGAISWIFAERAGFGAYGRYMHRFAHSNRRLATVLGDRAAREKSEPFLTGEAFHIYFELMYEMESALRVFLALVFNSIVLGLEIDGGLPVAYAVIVVICLTLQYAMRKPTTAAYAQNQKKTNRLTAQSYTAWDNIFAGNRYNYRVWNAQFKQRLRDALRAQIRAIMVRESLSTAAGIISLLVVFATIAWVAWQAHGDTETLIALAATLPRQIEMAHSVLSLGESLNDLLAIWARIGGAAEHFHHPDDRPRDAAFVERIKAGQVSLRETSEPSDRSVIAWRHPQEALAAIRARPNGRINVRGGNGSGKSTLLALLKQELGASAYFWPTTDRLAFGFSTARAQALSPPTVQGGAEDAQSALDDEQGLDSQSPLSPERLGFSAGEWQIKTLEEIVRNTRAQVYLLDEWDANLDASNRARANALMNELAARARVVEISHRDAAQA